MHIIDFARSEGIGKDILIGRLENEGIIKSERNDLFKDYFGV